MRLKVIYDARMPFRSAALPLLLLGLLTGCGLAVTSAGEMTSSSSLSRQPVSPVQGRWWTWAASEPESTNPVSDPTGKFCDRNQPQDVWFLAGTFGGTVQRTCQVPAGRPLAAPLVNWVATKAECEAFLADAKGEAVLDGKPVPPELLRDTDVLVTGVAGNPVTHEEGSFASDACGLWVRLPPLEPGAHTLTIRGSSGGFATGVDYTLIVVDQQQQL
jgi:hypothetical protein